MSNQYYLILAIFLFFICLEMIFTGFFRKQGQQKGDTAVEVLSTITLTGFTQPAVLFMSVQLASMLWPSASNLLIDLPVWQWLLLFLLADDLTQYWWHRLSHTTKWLYNLHRPHHNAQYLSIRVVYRNNCFYYLLMPGLWLSGLLVYMGGGWIYASYLVVKMTVIFGAHSDVRWDEKLYSVPWLHPIMWLLERIISTAATHAAHHGKHASDGITHYKGNFGNLLFFWDILFGTAKITRQYPSEFGVENLPKTTVGEQLLWPLISVKRKSRQRKQTSG